MNGEIVTKKVVYQFHLNLVLLLHVGHDRPKRRLIKEYDHDF
jgi:hypothetical protein